jgi:hypothetical protein
VHLCNSHPVGLATVCVSSVVHVFSESKVVKPDTEQKLYAFLSRLEQQQVVA